MDDRATLAEDVANIEAVRAVKRLQHAWGHYAEARDFAAMADLFARRGRLVLPPNEATGREEIVALLVEAMGEGDEAPSPDRLNVRLFLSPVISVSADGRSARGRWHEMAMTGRYGVNASWSGGIHENEYVVEGGAWKIAVLRCHPQFTGSHAEGWHNVSPAVPLVPFHFTPDSAGTPVPAVPTARDDLERDPAVLVAKARAAVDESLVHNLIAAYGYYVDRKLWDDVVDLFADDGVLTMADDAWAGRAAIRTGLETFGPAGLGTGEFFDHLQLMPVVTLDPDGARATLRGIEVQCLADHGVRGDWGVRICEGEFERVADQWRIASLRFSPRLLADHANGWEHDPPRRPRSSTAYPHHPGPTIEFPHPVRDRSASPSRSRSADVSEARRLLAIAQAFDGAENVACAYGYFLDEAHWDESAELFARDGWKELSFIGTYIGRERIRDSLVARYGRRQRTPSFLPIHQKTQPYVTVSQDGTRAQIRLKMFQVNSSWDGEASMVSGIYEEQAVVEDGIWRIHGMDLEYIAVASWSGGWAGVAPGLAKKFAPDDETIKNFQPSPDGPLRGLRFAPYPEIGPLGFHYPNPVSGREPELRFWWSDGRFDDTTTEGDSHDG